MLLRSKKNIFNFVPNMYVGNCRAADIQCWFLNLILMVEKVTSLNWFVKAFLVSWELFERNQYLVRFPPLLLLMLLNKTIPKTCFNCDWEQSLIADPSLGLRQCSKFSIKYRFRTLYVLILFLSLKSSVFTGCIEEKLTNFTSFT